MHILLSNDDGVHAKGIIELAMGMPKEWKITIIAPDRERSGHSHALTLRTPLCLKKLTSPQENITIYSFSGTPTDCTKFALEYYLRDSMPDLVLSGINNGYNLGSDVLYSGTVGAAMEAKFFHVPAMAISVNRYSTERGKEIIPFIVEFIKEIFISQQFKGLINMNLPKEGACTWEKVKVVEQGLQRYMDVVSDSHIVGKEGEVYFEIKGTLLFEKENTLTDTACIDEGSIPITALCWKQIDDVGNKDLAALLGRKISE